MAKKATAKRVYGYKPYPEPDQMRVGCKVSWHLYRDKAKAEECATAAAHNREIDLGLGYDFGYCWPGSISPPNQYHPDLYEVCIS